MTLPKSKTTVKLSWSTLNTWAKGDHETAVQYYLGKTVPATQAMELGDAYHKKWAQHIEQTNTIPDELIPPEDRELGLNKLSKPLVERFYGVTIPFSDELEIYLISRIDLVDELVVRDWKCGTSSPSSHISGLASQLSYYQLALAGNGIDVTEGRIVCFNPYSHALQVGVQFLDKETKAAALEHIFTFGGAMIDYLQSQKSSDGKPLLKDYDKDWRSKPASESQINYMKKLKVVIPENCTKGQASDLLDEATK